MRITEKKVTWGCIVLLLKECHILFYHDINDGPSADVPLVFEEWNK